MPTLLELQVEFLHAISGAPRASAAEGAVPSEFLLREILAAGLAPAQRLAIYANSAEANYLASLRASFPAILRLGGEEYFRQCGRELRRARPSHSGDLQDIGAAFPPYLATRHADDTYRYFGEVARLEWLYQEALTAADHDSLDLAALAAVPPARYESLRFRLHPSVRLFASEFPAHAIWVANVASDAEPEPLDLRQGADQLLLHRTAAGVEFQQLSAGEWAFLTCLAEEHSHDDSHIDGDSGSFGAALAAATAADSGFDAVAVLRQFVHRNVIVTFTLPTRRPTEAQDAGIAQGGNNERDL